MSWSCPACGGQRAQPRFRVDTTSSENGVDPNAFRPSTDAFGATVGEVVRCVQCGHGSLATMPPPQSVAAAYGDAADPVSIREEDGQVTTAERGLQWLESVVPPGRLLDIGCWTGSLLVAARRRGWEPLGVEPSHWAAQRARERGVDVIEGDLDTADVPPDGFDAVAMCDVLEHLAAPADALTVVRRLLRPHGALYLTVPDAGSPLARAMGRRWWSVLPMHLHYFTRSSMRMVLEHSGFRVVGVRTHAKVFTARYYAERLAGYSRATERAAQSALRATRLADRAVAPNFGDRMQVIAVVDGEAPSA